MDIIQITHRIMQADLQATLMHENAMESSTK